MLRCVKASGCVNSSPKSATFDSSIRCGVDHRCHSWALRIGSLRSFWARVASQPEP